MTINESNELPCSIIGNGAGEQAYMIKNCILIGYFAGADILDGDGIVIIGDNIRNLDKSQKDVMFLGEKVAIGKTLFGEPINVVEVIENHVQLFVQKIAQANEELMEFSRKIKEENK